MTCRERKKEMTRGEKITELLEFCDKHRCIDGECPLHVPKLKCGRGEYFDLKMSDADIDLAYSIAFPDTDDTPHILDSGTRREFESGAVRDVAEGKGRCDLLPLDIIGQLMGDEVLELIGLYIRDGEPLHLWRAIELFYPPVYRCRYNMLLEVAKHYEEGAKKYAERNWEKGISLHCYIDSGVRHYLKWLRGDNDEPHDRAFVWNMLGAIWTQKNLPNLIDLPFGKENEHDS